MIASGRRKFVAAASVILKWFSKFGEDDLQKERAISESECEDMNKKIKSKMYLKTSALSGKHVDDAFSKIAEELVERAKKMD